MSFPAASPEPSSNANAVESIFTESMRNRFSTSSPLFQLPVSPTSRPSSFSSISANQFWLELRIGNTMSGSARPRYSTSGLPQHRNERKVIESVVLAAPPPTEITFFLSEISSARAAYRLGSGSAKLSIHGDLLSDTVPSAQMSSVPGLRKKLSPIVVDESAATVRARFSNVKRLRSGVQVNVGGASTSRPGGIWKSTLLSWKPRPDTGAAYHQLRSKEFQPGCVSSGSKYEPSPTILPVTRRIPRARSDSAIASTAVHVESQPPGASVSIV